MTPRQPPPPGSGPKPVNMAGGRGNSQLSQFVQERMNRDEIWNIRSTNDLWVCPCCLSAIAKRPGLNHLDSIVRHLENCRLFALGKGQPQPRERILERRAYENLIHSMQTDPAWMIFDDDGAWISPFSLQRVPTLRAVQGKVDNFFYQALQRHLQQCPFYRQGIVHPAEEVKLARELHRRLPDVVRYAAYQLHAQDDWHWVNHQFQWICPFTLFAVPHINLRNGVEWSHAPRLIAQHLIAHCPRFATGQSLPHPAPAIAQAAGSGGRRLAPPAGAAPTPIASTQILGNTTRNGLKTLVPTPTGTPLANQAGSGRNPTLTPLSTPLNSGHTSSFLFNRSPIAGPAEGGNRRISVQAPPAQLSSPTANLAFAPDSNQPPTADIPAARPVARNRPPSVPPAPSGAPVAAIPAPPSASADRAPEPDGLGWMDQADSDSFQAITDPQQRTDLIHARQLQEKMLPQAPEMPGFKFAARFEACADITGDFFVFITLPEGRVGIALGDVSGHGMQAGLIMSMAKKTLEIYAAQDLGPADTLARVNDALVSDLGGKMFISMVYGVLDPQVGTITWARAGHNPTLTYNLVSAKAGEIRPRGMVVGMKSGLIFRQSLQEETTTLSAGDVFLLYTDGITETMNLQHEEFGTERLAAILGQFAGDGPEAVVDQVMERMRHFRGPRPAADDATLVALLVE
jgi:Stage II sporulation protein E (SpoIIE)